MVRTRANINLLVVVRMMGWLLMIEAVFMAVPLVTALIYGEVDAAAFGDGVEAQRPQHIGCNTETGNRQHIDDIENRKTGLQSVQCKFHNVTSFYFLWYQFTTIAAAAQGDYCISLQTSSVYAAGSSMGRSAIS